MNHDHASYQNRLDFVQRLLKEQFNLEVSLLMTGGRY
jgi:hypothetical protein